MINHSSPYGFILIYPEKGFYYSGEPIIGRVHLNIFRRNYPAESVILNVCCRIKHHYQDNEIVNTESVVLRRFSGSLALGAYGFPFNWKLGFAMPGSYDDYFAEIAYVLEAVVKVSQNEKDRSLLQHPIRNSMKLQIREKLMRPVRTIELERQYQVANWLCIKRGVVQLKACLNKNSFQIGELASLKITVDLSNSQLGLKWIEVYLHHLRVVLEQPYTHYLRPVTMNHAVSEGLENVLLVYPSQKKEDIVVQMKISSRLSDKKAQQSVRCALFHSDYIIHLVFRMEGYSCSPPPQMKMPIQVLLSDDGATNSQVDQTQQTTSNFDFFQQSTHKIHPENVPLEERD